MLAAGCSDLAGCRDRGVGLQLCKPSCDPQGAALAHKVHTRCTQLISPIVGVPFNVFIAALVAGHLPINFISVKVRADGRVGGACKWVGRWQAKAGDASLTFAPWTRAPCAAPLSLQADASVHAPTHPTLSGRPQPGDQAPV